MTRLCIVFVVFVLVGCGGTTTAPPADDDDDKVCGPGTTDVDGVCTADPPVMCTDGTIKDPGTGNCVIDPAACQDGTVLVGGACVDPAHVTPDITEAAEPNGVGLLGEVSDAPAGAITIKPIGEHFVIKGTIAPFQDLDGNGQLDADVDTYTIDVTGPTLVSISADGLHGLAAGFVATADVGSADLLAPWQRIGANLTGDTSKRQLFLPAAGSYLIGIADTRTLLFAGTAAGPAAGAPAFDYYITIDALDVAPVALTLGANGAVTNTGMLEPGEVKLFSVPLGLGLNTALYSIAASNALASMVVTNTRGTTTVVKRVSDAADPDPAIADVLGIRAGDTQIVVADHVFNLAAQPVSFALTIQTGDAGALSKVGAGVAQPASAVDFSVFFYDVDADDEVTGFNLSWSVPVAGVVRDENNEIFAHFTFDRSFGFQFNDTFTSYSGLLHHRTAGRYYFQVFDPTDAVSTITATSSYGPVALVPITQGTPLTAQVVNVFGTNPFTFDAGTTAWQGFRLAADGGSTTGNLRATYLPRNASFGRLDPLVSGCTVGGNDFCRDVDPVFVHTHAQAGTELGRVLLDDPTTSYFVTVRPTTFAGAQFLIDLAPRVATDLATIAAGASASRTNQVLSDTTVIQRYLVRTTATNGLTITTTPTATLNTRIQRLNRDETARGAAVNNAGAGAQDIQQLIQPAEGWTAFTVTSVATLAATTTFDLTVAASAAVTYTRSAGATAFSDACAGGGTTIAMQDLDEGFSTATLNVPAGFNYFGFAAPTLKVNSNGFLTFDTTLVCTTVGSNCFFGNAVIPNAANPSSVVAAYWDDLIMTSTCQKTIGTKLVIQWTGSLFTPTTTTVSFQAILDGATDTIELVYGPTQVPTGQSATIGIEDPIGSAGSFVGANTAGLITPGTSILFTPN